MKKIYLIPFVLVFLVACSGGETADESVTDDPIVQEPIVDEVDIINSFIITEGTVGLFVVGREVPKMPDELKIRQFVEDSESDAEGELHNVIFNQLEDVVELIMSENLDGAHHEDKVIEEMWVLSGYYETEKGISVGGTIEDFTAAYNDTKIYYSNTIDAFYMESLELPKVQFILRNEDFSGKPKMNSEKEEVSITDFEYGSKITKIRVH